MEPLEAIVAQAPTDPGVYLMKGEDSKILYVGKAKNLRHRVRSYFSRQAQEDVKTRFLVAQIRDIEFIAVGSEIEALLLENNLIKKHKPKYNIRLRDDKSYPYIRIDHSHPFPRPYIARRPQKAEAQQYFGPFTQGAMVHRALGMASKVFKLRDCRDHEFANRSRPCLSYQIGQCTAPCVGYVTADSYGQQLIDFVSFLEGRGEELESKWTKAMEAAAESMDFERAATLRDQLHTLRALSDQGQRMENATDRRSKDVWAFWPELFPSFPEDLGDLDLVVLQFRDGKLLGRDHYPLDVREKLLDKDFLSALMLQYYARKEVPEEILLPPLGIEWKVAEWAQVLSQGDREVAVVSADQTAEFSRLYSLALENAKLVAKEQEARRARRQDALKNLKFFLKLPTEPRRIECIDVSNFQGQANVASCVVFEEGRPKLEDYRHYKIKSVEGQNDFASMKEVIARRYTKQGSKWPDLLVLDGGKGQLAAVMEVFAELGLSFPVIALAKARTERAFTEAEVRSSQERVFLPGQKNYKALKNPEVLKLLTHLRDEAHRFAITFHRKKRDEQMFE